MPEQPPAAPAPQKEQKERKKYYYLVVINDDAEAPKLIKCEQLDAFEMAIAKNVLESKEPLYAFAFIGERIQLSPPQPVCAVEVGGEIRKVGTDNPQFDESGRIVPLVRNVHD